MKKILLVLLVIGAVAAKAAPICVRSLPFEIKASGHYFLDQDLACPPGTEGIRISAPDVTLDLCGFTVSTTSVSGNGAAGLQVGPVKNVTVKNGTIRGFATGVVLLGSTTTELNSAHALEGLRVLDCRTEGIYVEGGCGGTAIRRCEVLGIGPSATGSAIAIDFRCAYGVISENRVQCQGLGITILGPSALVANNVITATAVGISFGQGGSGVRNYNLVQGAASPYEGGSDGTGDR